MTVAGCGVVNDGEPRDLATERVPFGLLDAQTTTTITTTTVPVVTVPVLVYFLAGERLVPAARELPAPVSARDLLRSLLDGPTEDEAATGLVSAIAGEVRLLGLAVDAGVATIDLSDDFLTVGPPRQIEAIAQLVWTVTGIQGVSTTRFAIEGELTEVSTADGTLTRSPVGRAEYAAYAPP